MKIIKYIVTSVLLGVLVVLGINCIGQFFNFHLPVSILAIVLIGFLRIPGLLIYLIFLIL